MATIVRKRKPDASGSVFGVDTEAAQRALNQYLKREIGVPKPFCTCQVVKGYSFDPQIGVYLHAVPNCWKPSKAYYEAALRAGILGEVPFK